MAGSSNDDQPQGRKRFRSRSLERAFKEEGNHPTEAGKLFFRCYYCNAEIIPACLHVIDTRGNRAVPEAEQKLKTLHSNCLRPYLLNYGETNAKRDAERRSVIVAGGNDSGNRGDNHSGNQN